MYYQNILEMRFIFTGQLSSKVNCYKLLLLCLNTIWQLFNGSLTNVFFNQKELKQNVLSLHITNGNFDKNELAQFKYYDICSPGAG